MSKLFSLALSPIVLILFYIYFKDKYEKEPIKLTLLGTFYGIVISVPIIFSENFIMRFAPPVGTVYYAFFVSFLVASLIEEAYKYIILYFLIWKNKNFNEPLDGIVYGVFISLGFAGIENILYVLNPNIGGIETAIGRSIFSVPAHGFFGVFMGYYFALAKFKNSKINLIFSYLVPFFIHGVYDVLLFSYIPFNNILFLISYIYIAYASFKKIKFYLAISPFKK